MGIITPAPNVIGGLSLTAAVELLCAAHLLVCLTVVAQVSSVESITVGGLRVSPTNQCITAAWFLLGVPMIIHGGVGAVYRVESHLTAYMTYLLGCVALAMVWAAAFVRYGNTCTTLQPDRGSAKAVSFVCGITNAMVIFWLVLIVVMVAGAAYLVWSMAEYIRKRTETELLRYREPYQMIQTLADDIAMEQAADMQSAYQAKFVPPMPQYSEQQYAANYYGAHEFRQP